MSFISGNGDTPGVLFHGNGPALLPSRIHIHRSPCARRATTDRCDRGGVLTYTFYRRKNINSGRCQSWRRRRFIPVPIVAPLPTWQCRDLVDVSASPLRHPEHLSNLLFQHSSSRPRRALDAVLKIMTCRKEQAAEKVLSLLLAALADSGPDPFFAKSTFRPILNIGAGVVQPVGHSLPPRRFTGDTIRPPAILLDRGLIQGAPRRTHLTEVECQSGPFLSSTSPRAPDFVLHEAR